MKLQKHKIKVLSPLQSGIDVLEYYKSEDVEKLEQERDSLKMNLDITQQESEKRYVRIQELKKLNAEMPEVFKEIYLVREDELYSFDKIKSIIKQVEAMK